MNKHNLAPIGVFDSGIGGLTVVAEMLRQMPHESLIYYADTAHVPYGPRDPRELKGFAFGITRFLIGLGCKMVIIACNTSTSLAYEEMQETYDIPLVGVIEPGVDRALQTTKNGRIGVIATEATVKSGSYQKMLIKKNAAVEVVAQPCPLFVPFVEEGRLDGEEVERAARSYLGPLCEKDIDTLILGCTHYPFLLPVITQTTGPFVTPVDPARETVKRAVDKLKELNLLREEGNPVCRYLASGDAAVFARLGSFFLKREIGPVEKVPPVETAFSDKAATRIMR
ncbi:MAG: glutamate racemase [Peptococcaceae bacterium]|nr:glutamate racemase [Peptococcaceae bacterium]MDH7524198.1 glutamate racemase [Peptococcaceae bacterium]